MRIGPKLDTICLGKAIIFQKQSRERQCVLQGKPGQEFWSLSDVAGRSSFLRKEPERYYVSDSVWSRGVLPWFCYMWQETLKTAIVHGTKVRIHQPRILNAHF